MNFFCIQVRIMVIVLNATQQYFSYIVVVSFCWWRKPEKNQSAAIRWQTWSHNVVLSIPHHERYSITTLLVISTDCIGNCKSNYHTIMTMTASISQVIYDLHRRLTGIKWLMMFFKTRGRFSVIWGERWLRNVLEF
jgi:hypothetical protein